MKQKIIVIGVDPGFSGAIAFLTTNKSLIETISLAYHPQIIYQKTKDIITDKIISHIVIEDVHAMPAQGVCSMFRFGYSKGFCVGLFTGLGYADKIVFVSPQRWQKILNCHTYGNKNISKTYIKTLYPDKRITHRNAEAICLALYAITLGKKNNTKKEE